MGKVTMFLILRQMMCMMMLLCSITSVQGFLTTIHTAQARSLAATPISSFLSRSTGGKIQTTTAVGTSVAAVEETARLNLPMASNEVVQKVAVAGATGRTGRLVVEELLRRDVQVVAMVRSIDKAQDVFSDYCKENNNNNDDDKKESLLTLVACDLTKESDISKAVEGCDAAIWCATGFSDSQTSLLERFKRLFKMAVTPQQSIDSVGMPYLAQSMLSQVVGRKQQATNTMSATTTEGGVLLGALPKVVMLSSAGVTRPSWSEEKKEKYQGCADIPIVRLNPFGILNVKAESEEKLRQSGVNYCIVRPTGLNDKWPAESRPLLSQGDVAVGRINRLDVAKVLCDVLSAPEACDKTFEVVGLSGYPPARTLRPALARLQPDSIPLTDEQVAANFAILQQLLPGEVQDAAQLAMGQTYEELDQGKTGRLGERGTEDAEAVAPKPTVASSVK